VLDQGRPVEAESRYFTPDGPRDWLTYKFPIFHGSRDALVGGISFDITERKEAELQLRSTLQERTLLLQEIHHRVKNNLAVVVSLLGLQSLQVEDPEARAALQESQQRIHAMARVHKHLYQSPNLSRIDMAIYVRGLAEDIRISLGLEDVALIIDAEPVELDIRRAIPCALILNELISNAFKHGVKGAQNGPNGQNGASRVLVRLEMQGGAVQMSVYNKGNSLPEDFDLATTDSLGLYLVKLLARQLEGAVSVCRERGTTFTLCFPLDPEGSETEHGVNGGGA
jgi:two-component sensor histidine kinase